MEFLDFTNYDAVEEYEAFVQSRGGSFMQSVRWEIGRASCRERV